VVLGSAVYLGHWLEEAHDLVLRCGIDLWDRPVWLFSSGLGVDPLAPPTELVDVADVEALSRARGHVVFPGRPPREGRTLPERALVSLVRAPEGDVRDAEAAAAWGAGIGRELAGLPAGDPDPLAPAL
jgi:menaquinone-dependent protoporphyrinogen oxidase